jgi:hypothetical protein
VQRLVAQLGVLKNPLHSIYINRNTKWMERYGTFVSIAFMGLGIYTLYIFEID